MVRDQPKLDKALKWLGELHTDANCAGLPEDAETAFALFRIRNDLTTSYLLATAALTRTQSVGSHYRKDGVTADTNRNRVVLKKREKGVKVFCETLT